MDPLSITAGTIAVIGLVGKTCEGLYDAVENFSDVSADIRQHLSSIRSLRNTLVTISELVEQGLLHPLLDQQFEMRLRTCMDDLQEMERLAQSNQDRLEHGRRSKAWTRIRLSMKDRRRKLSSQLNRIESYHKNFCLDLLLLNIRQSLPAQCPPSVEQTAISEIPDIDFSNIPAESQSSQSDRFYMCGTKRRQYKGKLMAITAFAGSLSAMEDAPETKPRQQLELVLHLLSMRKINTFSFQIQWHLSLPTIVPRRSIVFQLAMKGDIAGMQAHFETGTCNPFCVSPNGVTLLHVAASEGQVGAVRFLIGLGAKVNATDDYGETPLHAAVAISQSYDICRLILDHGGDILLENNDGKSPLHTFFTGTLKSVLKYHEKSLIDFLAADKLGMTLLHYLASSSKTSRALFAQYYSSCAVTPALTDARGMSLLHLAVQRGNIPVITFLLEKEQASIYHRDIRGRTVMDIANASIRGADVSALLQAHWMDALPESQTPPFTSCSRRPGPSGFWANVEKLEISKSQDQVQESPDVECSQGICFAQNGYTLQMVRVIFTAMLSVVCFMIFR